MKAILFDMDGIIAYSEIVNGESYVQAFREENYNITIEDFKEHCTGKGSKHFFEKLKERDPNCPGIEKVRPRKQELFLENVRTELKLRKGIIDFIKKVHGQYKLAVVSAAHIDTINSILNQFNLRENFDLVISATESKRNKPYPDCYLLAAEKLNVKPEDCMVLEDSESGVTAGSRAGCYVIALPTKFTKEQDFSNADLVLDGFEEIDLNIIK
jgi:HAD superfamily hydrolase (TIGR01509 family)